uniref:Uncharacterized protein n=1 Tax=Panagrolaimus sp. JU765 TaxID=591449 RepID=A0AC34Q2E8_9BILA
MPKSLLFLLLTVPLSLGLSLTDYVDNEPSKSGMICMNDGFVFNDTSCVCKEFTSAEDCGDYHCINFGRAFTGDCSYGCDCPSGFRGPHCEPVTCVSNFANQVKAFNPVIRTFSVLITLNDFMLNLPNDNVTQALFQLVDQQPFSKAVDQLNVYIPGYPFTCPIDGNLKTCVESEIYSYTTFHKPSTYIYSLTGSDILNVLKISSTNSALMIVTNIGLTDYLSLTEMELIQQTAVARQIEINVVVASQYNAFQSVYSDPAYQPLITLTELTLGSFIAPYPLIGPATKDDASTIITTFGNLLASKTVVQANTLPSCNRKILTFNLFGDGTDNWDLYISIYLDDSFITDFSPTVLSVVPFASLPVVVDAGNWKLFKTSYTSSVNQNSLFINSTYSNACNYRIWTTSRNHTINLPHIYVAYTQADSRENSMIDASSALPVAGVANQVVAHIARVPVQMQSGFQFDIVLQNQTFTGTASSRDCLFNSYLTTVYCQNRGDIGRAHVRVSNVDYGYFEEVLPILCVNQENISASDTVNYISASCNGGVFEQINEISAEQLNCTAKNTLGLDESADRTFGLIYTNYQSLAALLSQKLQNNTFFNVLRNYNNAYDFTSFASAGCTDQTSLRISAKITDFLQGIATDLSAAKPDPATSNSTNEIKCISDVITSQSFNTFSDLIIITNQNLGDNSNIDELYKQLEVKRVKLHFIVFDTHPYDNLDLNPFYDLGARTAGSVVPITDKADIEIFFEFYGNALNPPEVQKRALSETVLSEYKPKPFSRSYTTASFHYNPSSTYYVMATVASGGMAIPTVKINGLTNQTYNFIMIGTSLGYFDIPKNLAGDSISLTITQYFFTMQLLINVFEIQAPQKYVVAFSTSKSIDADQAYPSFSGVGRLYVVASVDDEEAPEITITKVTKDSEQFVQNGTMQMRNENTCQFNDIFDDYFWQCKDSNGIYHIRLDTPQATRTAVFTCYANSGNLGCQNGGTPNSNNICSCPPGFQGDFCDEITCYNGGIVTDANTCSCTDLYDGPHCEIAKSLCYKQPEFPQYSSFVDTLIFVMEGNNDLYLSLKGKIENIPTVYRQYVLAVYSNGESYEVQVFNSQKYFVDYFNSLTDLPTSLGLIRIPPVLKAALYAVKTERSLLIWISESFVSCGDIDRADDELIGLIAKKRTEIRAFTTSNASMTTCSQSISVLGNGIPISVGSAGDIVKYITSITPGQPILANTPANNLAVLDSYISDHCYSKTINVPQDSWGNELILTLYGSFALDPLTPAPSSISSSIYKFGTGTKSFNLTCNEKAENDTSGYNLETLQSSRLAYTFGNSKYYVDQGFALSNDFDQSSLSFYLENVDDATTDFQFFPAVETSSIDVETFESSDYEYAQVIRPNCSYPWLAEIRCAGKPFKVRINNKVNNALAYQRIVTAYCLNSISCSVHSTKLLNGGCACDPWWSGTDCTIPTCLNGGTANRESCTCPSGFFGDNCQFKASTNPNFSAVNPERNILVILDVIAGPENGYFQFRQELAKEFVNIYKGTANTKFAFATNIDDPEMHQELTSNASDVISKIDDAKEASNDTVIVLSSALNFFNTQSFSPSTDIGYSVSYIFYISHSELPPADDYSAVAELAAKGVGIFTAYYANDSKTSPDTEILMSNALLGGITGSWTTYDIILRFANVLQFGSATPSPPPSTTTPAPIPCVKKVTIDVLFYVDITSNKNLEPMTKAFLADFSNDINFDGSEDASRATIGYAGNTALSLCFIQKGTFQNVAGNLRFTTNDSADATFDLYFTRNKPILTDVGERQVPRFLVYISDKTSVTNFETVKNDIKNARNETNVAFIGLGNPGSTEWNDIVYPPSLLFSLSETSFSSVKSNLYKEICK